MVSILSENGGLNACQIDSNRWKLSNGAGEVISAHGSTASAADLEALVKADLEADIAREIEEEISKEILHLSQKLSDLRARQDLRRARWTEKTDNSGHSTLPRGASRIDTPCSTVIPSGGRQLIQVKRSCESGVTKRVTSQATKGISLPSAKCCSRTCPTACPDTLTSSTCGLKPLDRLISPSKSFHNRKMVSDRTQKSVIQENLKLDLGSVEALAGVPLTARCCKREEKPRVHGAKETYRKGVSCSVQEASREQDKSRKLALPNQGRRSLSASFISPYFPEFDRKVDWVKSLRSETPLPAQPLSLTGQIISSSWARGRRDTRSWSRENNGSMWNEQDASKCEEAGLPPMKPSGYSDHPQEEISQARSEDQRAVRADDHQLPVSGPEGHPWTSPSQPQTSMDSSCSPTFRRGQLGPTEGTVGGTFNPELALALKKHNQEGDYLRYKDNVRQVISSKSPTRRPEALGSAGGRLGASSRETGAHSSDSWNWNSRFHQCGSAGCSRSNMGMSNGVEHCLKEPAFTQSTMRRAYEATNSTKSVTCYSNTNTLSRIPPKQTFIRFMDFVPGGTNSSGHQDNPGNISRTYCPIQTRDSDHAETLDQRDQVELNFIERIVEQPKLDNADSNIKCDPLVDTLVKERLSLPKIRGRLDQTESVLLRSPRDSGCVKRICSAQDIQPLTEQNKPRPQSFCRGEEDWARDDFEGLYLESLWCLVGELNCPVMISAA